MRTGLTAVYGAAVLTLLLAGCSAPLDAPAGGVRATPVTRATPADAQAADRALLAAVVLPDGAVPLRSAPAGRLSSPGLTLACTPLATAHGSWSVPGLSIGAAQDFLLHHPPHGLVVASQGTGAFGDAAPQTEVEFATPGTRDAAVLDVVAERTGGGVDLRADALVVPPHATCARAASALGGSATR